MTVKRVLVIDDEKHLCTIIQTCLQSLAGWAVETAGSGAEGLLKAKTAQPDAILLDVMMPDVDGVTLFRQLQTEPETQAIPVIFLTAKALSADQSQFSQLGVAGVITKPFDPLNLTHQIAQILGW